MLFGIEVMKRVFGSLALVRIRTDPRYPEFIPEFLSLPGIRQDADFRLPEGSVQNRGNDVSIDGGQPVAAEKVCGRIDRNDGVIIFEPVVRPGPLQRWSRG